MAERYDLANDVLSLGQDRAWRKRVTEAVAPRSGQLILDLAAGTGTSSEPIAQAGATVIATDLSFGMLLVGKQRRPGLSFVAADALHLPYADASFDAITISFGLRNVEDTKAALSEMRQVTKSGGTLSSASSPRPPGNRSARSTPTIWSTLCPESRPWSPPIPQRMSTWPSRSRPGPTSRDWPP